MATTPTHASAPVAARTQCGFGPRTPVATARRMQANLGNQAVLRLAAAPPISPSSRAIVERRLEVGGAHDAEESSAHAVAAAALRGEAVPVAPVMRRAPPAELGLGAGRPLDVSVRADLASTFGDALGDVHVHDDRAAARATKQLGARAFSLGGHIAFGSTYSPHSLEGRRLLAHELGHAVHGEACTVLRRDRNWDREVSHLTTSEIETELHTVRARLTTLEATTTVSTPEYDDLDAERAALERAMITRDAPRLLRAHRMAAVMASPTAFLTESPSQLFGEGIATGFLSEMPPGTVLDNALAMAQHPEEFQLGYLMGIPVGLWHGLGNLAHGLVSLGGLAIDVFLDSIPGLSLLRYQLDPTYRAAQDAQRAAILAIGTALWNFAHEVADNPNTLLQMSSDLGFVLGQQAAQSLANFMSKSLRDQGYAIGDIAGQVVFEIILQVVLAAATEGVGNIIRGVEAGAETVRYGGRIVMLIRQALDASPALRTLFRALTGIEHGADAARVLERTVETATTGERALETASTLGSGERRLATVESHADDAARGLQSPLEEVRRPSAVVEERPRPPAVAVDETRPRSAAVDETRPPSTAADEARPRSAAIDETRPPSTAADEARPRSAAVDETRPPSTAADEAHAPSTIEEPMTPGPAEPPAISAEARARARGRAAESDNFAQVDPLVARPAPPEPLGPPLEGNYRYVQNSHPPPPRSLRRVIADDERFAQLTVDPEGNVQYPLRTRPTPDVRATPGPATHLPPGGRLGTEDLVTIERRAADGTRVTETRPVSQVLTDRTEALARRDTLRAAQDTAGAGREAALARRETEALGDAAGARFRVQEGGTSVYEGRGPNTLDQVFTRSDEVYVVETKGGSATNTSSRIGQDGQRYQQGSRGYLESIIEGSLADPPTAQLPRSVAEQLQEALLEGRLHYVEISQPLSTDGTRLLAPLRRDYF